MKAVSTIASVLLIVGGLNWGLWGAFEFDLVAAIFGGNTAPLAKVIYIVVGLAAVVQAAALFMMPSRAGMKPALT